MQTKRCSSVWPENKQKAINVAEDSGAQFVVGSEKSGLLFSMLTLRKATTL